MVMAFGRALLLAMAASAAETGGRRAGRQIASFSKTRSRASKANRKTFSYSPKGTRKKYKYNTTTGRAVHPGGRAGLRPSNRRRFDRRGPVRKRR